MKKYYLYYVVQNLAASLACNPNNHDCQLLPRMKGDFQNIFQLWRVILIYGIAGLHSDENSDGSLSGYGAM